MELFVSEHLTDPKRSRFNPEHHRLNDFTMFCVQDLRFSRAQSKAQINDKEFNPCHNSSSAVLALQHDFSGL